MDVKAKDVGSPSFTRVALPGSYAISMTKDAFHTYYITAVAEGGRTTDVIHTDATVIKAWEKFRFINGGPTDPYFSIQTLAGYFLSAVNSGGLTANAITSAATSVGDWELLAFKPQSGLSYTPHFAIQTTRGYFLTAVGHGGHNSGDTIHSDATVAKDWEMFDFIKIGDPGTNSTYSFQGLYSYGGSGGFLRAPGGGRRNDSSALIVDPGGEGYTLAFTLIRQDDGTYALKTSSGYYVTANAGGLPGAGYRTDTPEVNNWEKFTIIPNETDCTSHIRTYNGTYLSIVTGQPPQPPNVLDNVVDIAKATRWRLWVMAFYA